jgi:antiviral helicase SKI2
MGDPSLLDDLGPLLDPISAKYDRLHDPPSLPYRLGPFSYAGLGSFRPDPPSLAADVLHIDATLPTMAIEPRRDCLTGAITDYVDLPISTDREDTGLNRPIGAPDSYVKGDRGIPFSPAGISPTRQSDDLDFESLIASLDSGTFLLSSPFTASDSASPDAEPLPDLPDLAVQATVVANPWDEVETIEECTARLDDWDDTKLESEVPHLACEFPYRLDPFQRRAVYRLERGEPVFVAAPTSAGKTAVAQYAIGLCRSHKMRAIYTSPIKALSNQKYRDFHRSYGDVGILTGDVSLNREAPVLIMTTEILRSMLYRGADVLRDVECVIFDECHYISDPERGVVWEESIIMMPPHINMVFLSATAPNDLEIASWIARTKHRIVWVERHLERPVPLSHKFYFNRRISELSEESAKEIRARIDPRAKNPAFTPRFWQEVIGTFHEKDLLPALMFTFSQKQCEKLAGFAKGVKLIGKNEQNFVRQFCERSIHRLSPEDRALPQVVQVRELLECGIGVHHGGLLPLLKEIVEMLLADGFLKVLFCTSTFAMGINVPARTCAFTQVRKFNGKEHVLLTPTEYIQMSGRAGRRGLDTVGTAILILSKEVPDASFLQSIRKGQGEALQSHFYVRPNMVLNLKRVQGIRMEDILKRTLSANAVESKIPQKQKELEKINESLKRIQPIDCINDIEDAAFSFANVVEQMKEIRRELALPASVLTPVLEPGRVVLLCDRIGVVASSDRGTSKQVKFAGTGTAKLDVDQICGVYKEVVRSPTQIPDVLAKLRKRPPPDIQHILKRSVTSEMAVGFQHLQGLFLQLATSPCYDCPQQTRHVVEAKNYLHNDARRALLESECRGDSEAYTQVLNSHVRALTKLGEMANGVITLKGRVAIEMRTTANELICAELLYRNYFDELSVPDVAALTSCLLAERLGKDAEENIPPELEEKVEEMVDVATMVLEVTKEAGIDVDEENWIEEKVNPRGITAVKNWMLGMPFRSCLEEGLPEGGVVRMMTQTATQLTCFAQASLLMGNKGMAEVFEEAAVVMQRGIIFTSSLYLD